MEDISLLETAQIAKGAYDSSGYRIDRWHSYHKTTDTRAVVTLDREINRVTVAFRGTFSLRNWVTNLYFWPKDGVHRGVSKAVDYHYGSIQAYLRFLELNEGLIPELIVVGHSLGGALAVELSGRLYEAGKKRIVVVTFGAVRAHKRRKALNYKAGVGRYTVRVTSNNDIVTRLLGFLYYHVGWRLHFDCKGMWHMEVSRWFLFKDCIKGRFRSPIGDSILDHSIESYVELAKSFPYGVVQYATMCIELEGNE